MYALIKDQTVVKYPYTIRDLIRDNPRTSFPADMTNEQLAEWGVYTVRDTPEPVHDATLQRAVWGAPVLTRGEWVHSWELVELDQAERDRRTEQRLESASMGRLEFMLSLLDKGLLDQVESLVDQSDRRLQLYWNNAIEFRRSDAQLAGLLDSTSLDKVFGLLNAVGDGGR
jgi:hypothetical protein